MTLIEMRLFAVLGILLTAVLAVAVVHVTFAAIRGVRTWAARIHVRRLASSRAVPQRPAVRRLPC